MKFLLYVGIAFLALAFAFSGGFLVWLGATLIKYDHLFLGLLAWAMVPVLMATVMSLLDWDVKRQWP